MDFPRYVFTKDGDKECELGTYGTEIVEDKDELTVALKEGYKEELSQLFDKPEPKKKFKKANFKKEAASDDDEF